MENRNFEYTYSASEQAEVKRIKEKYLPREERQTKLEQLKALDASVERRASVLSLSTGILGTLLMGLGMSCTMVWADRLFVPGIVIGLLGIAVAAAAYPIYKRAIERQREKLAPLIMKLAEELEK